MSVLTRYLLRAHIGPMVFAFIALTGVILINTVAKEMASLAGKGLSASVLLEFFILSLPANIALTLPMSVLVAVLYTFSTMASENEIMALKASGVDLRRVARPVLIGALAIALGMVWFNDRVLPEANYRWRMLMVDVGQASPLLLIREQIINPIQGASGLSMYYLQAAEVDAISSRLGDVTIYDVSDHDIDRTIYADSGYMAFDESRTDLMLTLFDGHINEVDFKDPTVFQQMHFGRQVLRMAGVSQQLERSTESNYRTDRDMTVGMMQTRVDSLRQELVSARALADTARMAPPSAGSPLDMQARVDQLQFNMREYQFEIHKKYSIAAATLVFVLIGIPMALRLSRGGVGMVIAMSLVMFAIYYVGLIGGETLSDEGYVPPMFAAWLMNGIFGILGLAGLRVLGNEQSSGRGGGWGDLPRWLRFGRRSRSGSPAETSR